MRFFFFALPTSICNFTSSAIETVLLFGTYKSLIVQQGTFVSKLGVAHIFNSSGHLSNKQVFFRAQLNNQHNFLSLQSK